MERGLQTHIKVKPAAQFSRSHFPIRRFIHSSISVVLSLSLRFTHPSPSSLPASLSSSVLCPPFFSVLVSSPLVVPPWLSPRLHFLPFSLTLFPLFSCSWYFTLWMTPINNYITPTWLSFDARRSRSYAFADFLVCEYFLFSSSL